jgi:hypothetical protein
MGSFLSLYKTEGILNNSQKNPSSIEPLDLPRRNLSCFKQDSVPIFLLMSSPNRLNFDRSQGHLYVKNMRLDLIFIVICPLLAAFDNLFYINFLVSIRPVAKREKVFLFLYSAQDTHLFLQYSLMLLVSVKLGFEDLLLEVFWGAASRHSWRGFLKSETGLGVEEKFLF